VGHYLFGGSMKKLRIATNDPTNSAKKQKTIATQINPDMKSIP